VRLVIQIEAVRNQLVNVNFGRTIATTVTATGTSTSVATAVSTTLATATIFASRAATARRTVTARGPTTGPLFARRAIPFWAFFGFLLFCLSHWKFLFMLKRSFVLPGAS
jgi:hypothetical protein